jgi:hypothetical protein
MSDPSDDIDEVALNVLLAEGLDVPAAVEASRRSRGSGSAEFGWFGLAVLIIASLIFAAAIAAEFLSLRP